MSHEGQTGRDIDADPYKLKQRMGRDASTISELKASHASKPLNAQERVERAFSGLRDLDPLFSRIIAEHNRHELTDRALGNIVAINEGWDYDEGDNEGGVMVRPLGDNPHDSGSEKLALPTAA